MKSILSKLALIVLFSADCYAVEGTTLTGRIPGGTEVDRVNWRETSLTFRRGIVFPANSHQISLFRTTRRRGAHTVTYSCDLVKNDAGNEAVSLPAGTSFRFQWPNWQAPAPTQANSNSFNFSAELWSRGNSYNLMCEKRLTPATGLVHPYYPNISEISEALGGGVEFTGSYFQPQRSTHSEKSGDHSNSSTDSKFED